MKSYTLYNKDLGINLEHPGVGLWFTTDIKEANEMLVACHEYLVSINASEMIENFVIIEVGTEKEVKI